MLWIGPRDAAQHPTVYRIIHPQQRITQPQMSVLEEDLEKGGGDKQNLFASYGKAPSSVSLAAVSAQRVRAQFQANRNS